MKFRLRTYDSSPPGGYHYGPLNAPMIEPVARQLQKRRLGNNKPRATYPECLEDVDLYMANTVLKGDPTYTIPMEEGQAHTFPLQSDAPGFKPCKGCGIPVLST